MYGSLLRMRTFFTIYNCMQRVLISEAGRCYPRKRFSQYCVNSCGHQKYDLTRKLDLFSVVPMFSQFFLCFPDSVFPLPLSSDVFPCFPIFSYFFPCFPPCFCSFLLLCFQLFSFVFPCFLLFSYLFLFLLFFPVSPYPLVGLNLITNPVALLWFSKLLVL